MIDSGKLERASLLLEYVCTYIYPVLVLVMSLRPLYLRVREMMLDSSFLYV